MADGDALIRRVVGCMTGTSLDGIDVALGVVRGRGLEEMSVEYGGMVSRGMPAGLREGLLRIAEGGAVTGLEVLRLRRGLGELHAEAVGELIEQEGGKDIDLVVAHGQTVWHAPGDEAGALSWQLFDPWPVVRRLGVPVCYDLRQADLIAGGQGAPITPVSDWVMYRGGEGLRADVILNLGGIVNRTTLDARVERVLAADSCPCNLLLDGLCQRLFDEPFDQDGVHAARGRVDEERAQRVIELMVSAGSGEGRSLGREQFNGAWMDSVMGVVRPGHRPEDVLATAVEAIALWLQQEYPLEGQTLVLAGGGTKNRFLVERIRAWCKAWVCLSDELGIPAEGREALGMAVLGALSWDCQPITFISVTGAAKPGVAGAWVYPAGYERER